MNWISADARLPHLGIPVLVYVQGINDVCIAYLKESSSYAWIDTPSKQSRGRQYYKKTYKSTGVVKEWVLQDNCNGCTCESVIIRSDKPDFHERFVTHWRPLPSLEF